MSIKVSKLVWDAELPPTLKLVSLCLADYCRDDGTQARPSQQTISDKTGLSKVTVGKALKELVSREVILVDRPPTNRRPAVFLMNLALLIDLARGKESWGQESWGQADIALTTSGLSPRGVPGTPNPLDTPIENHYGDSTPTEEEREAHLLRMRSALRKRQAAE